MVCFAKGTTCGVERGHTKNRKSSREQPVKKKMAVGERGGGFIVFHIENP